LPAPADWKLRSSHSCRRLLQPSCRAASGLQHSVGRVGNHFLGVPPVNGKCYLPARIRKREPTASHLASSPSPVLKHDTKNSSRRGYQRNQHSHRNCHNLILSHRFPSFIRRRVGAKRPRPSAARLPKIRGRRVASPRGRRSRRRGDEVNKVCALRPVDPLAGILETDLAVAVVGKQHRVAQKARGATGVDAERGCRPQESWR
jgi:hypothetical protein